VATESPDDSLYSDFIKIRAAVAEMSPFCCGVFSLRRCAPSIYGSMDDRLFGVDVRAWRAYVVGRARRRYVCGRSHAHCYG